MNALTRKVGPLPVWAYAVILGGAFLAVRMLRGGTKQQDASVQLIPTGAPPIDASAGFLNDLSLRLDRIESTVTSPPPASSDGTSDTPDPLKAIRDAVNADVLKRIQDALKGATGGGSTPAPPASGGSGTKPPATSPPVSAKPTGTLSRSAAAEITRRLGFDPAKVFGYGTNAKPSSFWVNNPDASYVWRSASDFEAWLKRATRDSAVANRLR